MTSESPYKRLRLLAGIQQKDLAAAAGVSVTALVNIEAGLYETVPQRANLALGKACRAAGMNPRGLLLVEYHHSSLDGAMRAWQERKRSAQNLAYLPAMPLERLISGFKTRDAFCKALCIPTAALHNYTSGKLRVLPSVIRDALQEAGYGWVDEMEEMDRGIGRSEPEPVQG